MKKSLFFLPIFIGTIAFGQPPTSTPVPCQEQFIINQNPIDGAYVVTFTMTEVAPPAGSTYTGIGWTIQDYSFPNPRHGQRRFEYDSNPSLTWTFDFLPLIQQGFGTPGPYPGSYQFAVCLDVGLSDIQGNPSTNEVHCYEEFIENVTCINIIVVS